MPLKFDPRITIEEQVVHLYDTVDPLLVNPTLPPFFQNAVHDRCHTAIAIRGPSTGNLPEKRQAVLISGLTATAAGFLSLFMPIGRRLTWLLQSPSS